MRNGHNGDGAGELERLGPDGEDILVLGVEAPGFDALTPREKTLAYYLYRAALPGNRIAFRQSHRDAYDIKSLLEAIFLHAHGLKPSLRAAVHDYLKYVWIHHGPYDHFTHTKFVPRTLTREGLREAAAHAARAGAPLPLRPSETAATMLSRLDRTIFDADHEPLQTNQAEGEDIIATSAVNYWDPGVTAAELEALAPEWRHRLNVRFSKVDGRVVPEVYRIGGLYGEELAAVSHFVARALAHAEPGEQVASIESLLSFYRSGDEEDFRRHMVHWLRSDARVDFLNGFIEVYLDPRGAIGQFEANVNFRSAGGLIDRIAEHAGYFERRMPWDDAYKRTEVGAPVASLASVVVETGDAGPVSPAAYNLPNYNDIRRDHGSKNVILENVENTWSQALEEATVGEFFLSEYREPMQRYFRPLVRPLFVFMHEIIGHGSGRPAPDLGGDPRAVLGRTYSTLEECRADLVALWHIADPKLVEVGAFRLAEQRTVVEVAYVSYLQGWFSRIDRLPGLEVREAHNRAHHAILCYLCEGGGQRRRDFGVEVVRVKGDYFVRVADLERAREGVGELLSRVQAIKSTADRSAAEALFDRFGARVDKEWKTNVAARRRRIRTPKLKAFVFPRLEPVLEGGEIVDVRIHHDEDLTAQQLRFSRLEMSREIADDRPEPAPHSP